MIAGRMISGDVVGVLSGGSGTESSWIENLRQAMEYGANVDVLTQTLFKLVAVGAAVSAALAHFVAASMVVGTSIVSAALLTIFGVGVVLCAIGVTYMLFIRPKS